MITAAILFAITAIGGVVMAAIRLRGEPYPPLWIPLVHGAVGAAGLVTLIVTMAGRAVPTAAMAALIGFLLAALGGSLLFLGFHLRHKPLPVPLMLLHGTVAVISFVILLIAIYGL
jgi:hypothetical protein